MRTHTHTSQEGCVFEYTECWTCILCCACGSGDCVHCWCLCAYKPTFVKFHPMTQPSKHKRDLTCLAAKQGYGSCRRVCVCEREVTPLAAEVSGAHPPSLSWLAPVLPASAVSPENRNDNRLDVRLKHLFRMLTQANIPASCIHLNFGRGCHIYQQFLKKSRFFCLYFWHVILTDKQWNGFDRT